MGGDKPSDFATGIPADSELWRGDSRSQCHPSFMGATGVTKNTTDFDKHGDFYRISLTPLSSDVGIMG